ncbi:MAG: tRNA (N6-threonylcarbamoyladenosine(37)-N6)-methyltransferase TrmO [Thermotogota bacterium]|nr:tRNA (N6-threonylcarbamoyladenosine(37)-N6)-methyltransferase TrmO [Thermotogota bacterium]
MKFEIQSIGVIHSPFINKKDAPPQVSYSSNTIATVEIYPVYVDGINGLERFEYIIIISYLHKSQGYSLMTIPRTDNKLRGVFSTRSPHRPNPIALSITKLLEIKNNILHIQGIDLINGTPVLDIKPYIKEI